MKRLFLILLLISEISFTAEKNNNQKNKEIKTTNAQAIYMLSSLNVHELMANRQLAPHVACLLLWGDFHEEISALFRK